MKKFLAATLSASIALAGCATSSQNIASISTSPLQYNSFDCNQLEAENARLTGHISRLGGRLDEAASNDKAIMGVGLILFWPALFALGGTKQQEAEYGKVKGEYEALQQASIQKKCAIPAQAIDPATPKAQEAKNSIATQAPINN